MSKLKELIAELCPNGVEYIPLKELFNTRNGYTPSKTNKEFWENGTIPWFRMEDIRENGGILSNATQCVSEKAVKGSPFPENSIIVATSATIGVHALITVPSLANQRFTYLMLKEAYKDKFNIKFVYYCCFLLDDYCKANLNQSSFASVDMKKFNKFCFPVPPLPVQEEIVRILDSFTSLTAELQTKLQAELQARQKQYEYYRDQLLTFDVHGGGTSEVQWKTLGEVSDIISGFPFDSSQFTESGIRLMRGMNVKRGKLDFSESNNRYWSSYDGLEKYLLDTNDIVIAMDGSLVGKSFGVVTKPQLPLLLVQRVARIRVTGANSRYVYHCVVNSFSSYVDSKKTEGAVPHISLKDISKFKIPTPPITIQNRIAEVLDNFDAICSDLNIGLPAEIEARQKQYEYYRDRLLSFPKLT